MDWYGDIGAIHAGHWKTQAAAGNHRFNEDNIHCQKLACNLHHAGRQSQMRDGMVARIGLERVEAIEYDTRTKNWTREELLEITLMYRAKLKELKGKQ